MTDQPKIHDFRHTICGPFDLQFTKKFLGKKSESLSLLRQRIIKAHQLQTKRNNAFSQQNLLPRIKQIQKITKQSKPVKKRKIKMNQYVDGVSDLQLYITKKLINQKSTQQIVSKLQKQQKLHNPFSNGNGLTSRKAVQFFSKTQNVFNQPTKQSKIDEKSSKTMYAGQNKWVSDKQFTKKFDKFIIMKQNEQAFSIGKTDNKQQQIMTKDQIKHQLSSDKNTLQTIVKKMIHEHNYQTELQVQQDQNIKKGEINEIDHSINSIASMQSEVKDIHWIMKSCEQLQKKFNIKKKKKKDNTNIKIKI